MLGEVKCYFESKPSLQEAETPMLAAEFDTPLQAQVGLPCLVALASVCLTVAWTKGACPRTWLLT